MYATIRRYEGVKDTAQAARRVSEGFVPVLRAISGFVAYYWVDAGNGVMISTSVYESREGAEQSNKKASEWARQNLSSVLPNPPATASGEVVASSVPAEAGAAR